MSEPKKKFTVEKIIKQIFIALLAIGFLVIIVPNFIKVRNTPSRNSCINSLRQLDGAKQQWALENHKDTNAIPTTADVAPYLKNNHFPVCPKGGKYTICRVGEDPTCSIPGDVLPAP
jgi:hypothetical protein